MNLLIITQKVDKNDDILGFFHGWLIEFAKHVEKLTVITLQEGDYDLPDNVEILSLGKEKGVSRIGYILAFYKYIWQKRSEYSHVFVHMNQIYVVMAGPLWRLWGKRIALWYTHKQITLSLRLAEKFVHKVLTASKESFRLPSKKVEILGHGIDVSLFSPNNQSNKNNNILDLLTIGRISPSKNYMPLLQAVKILRDKGTTFSLKIVGGIIYDRDKQYLQTIKEYNTKNKLNIEFIGPIANRKISNFYKETDIFINLGKTGGLDKTTLEAMASGCLVLTSNETYANILDQKYFSSDNPVEIADKIEKLSQLPKDENLREYVVQNHNVTKLVPKIISSIKNKTKPEDFHKVIKYIISGGTAAIVNLASLFVLTNFFGVWYLLSAVFAFVLAFLVSYLMQKFWTFGDKQTDKIMTQAPIFFVVQVFNLIVNIVLLYMFVEFFDLYYLLGQILAGGLIAVYSFFIYKLIIFKKS